MKQFILSGLVFAFLISLVSCSETKKESEKPVTKDENPEFTTEVSKITDLKCESAGLRNQMLELEIKYAKSPNMLMEADLIAEEMALCESIDEETIEKFRSRLVKGFLDTKGDNLYLEYILDDDGLEIGYLFKNEKDEVVGNMEKTELSDETKTDVQKYVDLFCQYNEINNTIIEMFESLKEKSNGEKGFRDRFRQAAKELLSNCSNISSEKLEQILSEL